MDIFFKKVTNKVKNTVCFRQINPHKHWSVILRLFFMFVIVSILFSLCFLYKIKNDQIAEDVPKNKEAPNLINEKLLKNVTESFEMKAIKEREARNTLE